jgi:hypothetical protein
MRRFSLICVITFSTLIFTACSNDDDSLPQNTNNYFPLTVNNSWDYDNAFTATGQDDFFGSETMSITGTIQLSGNDVHEVESSNPQNSGLSTLILTQGVLYKNNTGLIYTGEFGLGLPEFSNIAFDIENAPVYNKQVPSGTEMFVQETSFQEQFEGFPITLNFKIKTVMGESLSSLSVNGTNYADVISSQWIIELEVVAGVPPISTLILEEQKISEITNYFAKDVGMIRSESTTTLNFVDNPLFELEDIDSATLQELVNHNIVLD